MFARNMDFICVASSAFCLAPVSAISSILNSVMSWVTPKISVASPAAFLTTWPSAWIQTTRPSTGRL